MNLHLYPTRDAWLAERGIGASEVAAILGLPGFARPFDVYARHRLGHTTPDNEAMAAGRAWERGILAYYEEVEGVEVVTPRTVEAEGWRADHPEHSWATCSPDGLVLAPQACLDYDHEWLSTACAHGVEAKRSRVPREWGEPGDILPGAATLPIPEAYYLQCLWSLLVTGLPRWDLVASVWGDGRIYRVHADPARQAALLRRVSEWRTRYLLGEEIPPVDGSDGADVWLRATYPTGANRREATDEERADALRYDLLGTEIRQREEERKIIGQRIRAAAGDLDGLDLPTGKVSIVRAKGRETVDTKRLRAEEPAVYQRFVKTGEPSHSVKVTINEES